MDKPPRGSSPSRCRNDLKAGGRRSEAHQPSDDPFHIISLDPLSHWRQAALVLNASRRFRYTLHLKKEEQVKRTLQKIRAHAQVIRAAQLFQAQDQQANGISKTPVPSGDFGIAQEQLALMTRDCDVSTLGEYGGVKGLAELLKTNLEKGIHGDDADSLARKNTYGSNTYPRKKGRTFWMFLWEAWQDLTLIILIIAAVASLVLGIKSEGIKEGWYDGGSIAFAVILVIVVTGDMLSCCMS